MKKMTNMDKYDIKKVMDFVYDEVLNIVTPRDKYCVELVMLRPAYDTYYELLVAVEDMLREADFPKEKTLRKYKW